MTEPLQPEMLEENGKLINIAAWLSYFVVGGLFFPVSLEELPQAPLIECFNLRARAR